METRVDRGWCSRWGHPSRDPSIEISIMQIDSSRSDRCCLVTGNATNHHDCAHWCMISVLPTSYVRRIVIPPLLIVVSRCFVRTRGSWCRKNVSWDFVSLAKDRENLASFMSLSSIVKSFGKNSSKLVNSLLAENSVFGGILLLWGIEFTTFSPFNIVSSVLLYLYFNNASLMIARMMFGIIPFHHYEGKSFDKVMIWKKGKRNGSRNCVDNSIE